jgi:transcriptional regulator with XRE-family HTH domain
MSLSPGLFSCPCLGILMLGMDGEAVRRARESRYLTQVDLAGLAGVSQSVVSRVETGVRHVDPKFRARVYRVAEALLLEDSRGTAPSGDAA